MSMAPRHDPEKTVYIIDGSSFLYRAYYAMKPLHTNAGEPVNAVYGFCRMIKKIIDDFSPHYCALVWDAKAKTQRHELYAEYKAGRQARPQDMDQQKDRIISFAELIGIKNITREGVEADDVMVAIARYCVAQGYTVVMITSDKDLRQAVTSDILIYDPFQEKILSVETIERRYGVNIDKLPFYFALIGDSSDNIPGVSGIGPKTAQKLVNQFASLEDLYENIDDVEKERTKKLLRESKEDAFLSRKLFTIQACDVDIKPRDITFNPDDWKNARPLFQELDFTSLLKQLPSEGSDQKEQKKTFHERYGYYFEIVNTPSRLREIVAYLYRRGFFAIDTETDSLQPMRGRLVGISVCAQEGYAYYIPVNHNSDEQQLSLAIVQHHMSSLCADASVQKYLHNAKFDMHILSRHGMPLYGISIDTLIAAYLVTRTMDRLSLSALSETFFGETMYTYKDVVTRQGYRNFGNVPVEQAYDYAAADAHQTYRLVSVLQKKLQEQGQEALLYDIEMPVLRILYDMEQNGIIVNTDVLDQLRETLHDELTKIKSKIISYLGEDYANINLNSPQQIAHILFKVLGLTPIYKTAGKTGYSTSHEVLKKLAQHHPVPDLIMRYRELFKLKSTYVDTLGTFINPQTGRVHTTFSQTSTATGRLSSSDPNLQNIPLDSYEHGVHIRMAFQAPKRHVLLAADYSQIELRILAHMSGDSALQQAFIQEGADIHRQTASGLFGISQSEVTNMQRQLAKRINFSIIYGLTPYGLSQDLGISRAQAKQYIDTYMAQYPSVTKWMEHVVAETKEHGYVQTLWGRRRYIPSIYDDNKTVFDLAKRTAINTAVQGTAADLMKVAMIEVDAMLQKQYSGVDILLQVHDELILSVPEYQADTVSEHVKTCLEDVVSWSVPMEVNVVAGATWHDISK